jgi:predicted alpha/beta superfamily hydrolase
VSHKCANCGVGCSSFFGRKSEIEIGLKSNAVSRRIAPVRYLVVCIWLPLFVVAQCNTQAVHVTFKVITPVSTPRHSKIYVAGNDNLLGNWNPGAVGLNKENDSVWTGTFSFRKGRDLEYKITRGGWNNQAIYEDGQIPGNSRLTAYIDTEVIIRPLSWSDIGFKAQGGILGAVRYHGGLKGEGLRFKRDLIVWLPPSYEKKPGRRYPVLYMHDGQNIIDPSTSFAGYDWRMDEVADSLIRAGKMKEIIIVGIYNSPDRMIEYSDTTTGRAYADFVVHIVKPLIDSTYRTLPDRSNTAVMGSSLGGLVSFLFAWWYPDVFSEAACLSSVFSYNGGRILSEVEAYKGPRKGIRIYVDCGGYAGEAMLKPGMDKMVGLLRDKGYMEGRDLERFFDASAEHSERAWAARVWRPLEFLFGD